jgi:hypothetical protein
MPAPPLAASPTKGRDLSGFLTKIVPSSAKPQAAVGARSLEAEAFDLALARQEPRPAKNDSRFDTEVYMRVMSILFSAALASGMVVAAIWGWQQSQDLVLDHWNAGRPELAEWAIRSAAIAVVALAQIIVLTFVAGRIYFRRTLDSALTVTAGVVVALATVGAIACGLAGR